MGPDREKPQSHDAIGLDALAHAAAAWGLPLSALQRENIARYADEILAHNRGVNLTAAASVEEILTRHVADGLAAVPTLRELLGSRPGLTLCDLGSGAGFIGIAVKLAWPSAVVTLLESKERKFKFLNLVAARMGLKGLRVARLDGGVEFDAVLARALAPLPSALARGLPLVKNGGYFLAYQSSPSACDGVEISRTLARYSSRLLKSIPYHLPRRENRPRYLVVFRKEEN